MRSSASLVLLLLLLAVPAVAPAAPRTAAAPAAVVPEPVAARVVAQLASQWGVPEADLHLVWGRLQGALPATAELPFRVAGRGADGWLVVVFDPASRTPGAVRVRAGVDDTVLVAARPLAAGTRLGPGDTRREPRLRWGPPATRSGPEPETGWEVRRAVAAGEVLSRPAVVPPALVAAGAPVRFVWAGGPVQVSVTGIALNTARQGEIVRARVEGRPDRLVGTVIAAGMAELSTGGIR